MTSRGTYVRRAPKEPSKPVMLSEAAPTLAAALSLVGRDGIIRDDPLFGRRGLIKAIIEDATHGYLALVVVYKEGTRAPMEVARPGARQYRVPAKVELA